MVVPDKALWLFQQVQLGLSPLELVHPNYVAGQRTNQHSGRVACQLRAMKAGPSS